MKPIISFLITHYNRPNSLKKCIGAIKELNLDLPFEIIVSDDYSSNDVIYEIKTFDKCFELILAEKNEGLAANINKGIKKCKGEFILYCQEDFLINSNSAEIIKECMFLLNSDKVDMVRLKANYKFPKTIPISENIGKIPFFSLKNFKYNAFRYSDNPFIVKFDFYDKFGFYLENTSGHYGEMEYAIRVLSSNVRIAISNNYYFSTDTDSVSVLNFNDSTNKKKSRIKKTVYQYLRALRLHIEWLFYNPNDRKLWTYKNQRVNDVL